jgi:hypothetical protein
MGYNVKRDGKMTMVDRPKCTLSPYEQFVKKYTAGCQNVSEY